MRSGVGIRSDLSSSCCRAPRHQPWDVDRHLTRRSLVYMTEPRPKAHRDGQLLARQVVNSVEGTITRRLDSTVPVQTNSWSLSPTGPPFNRAPTRTLPSRGCIIARRLDGIRALTVTVCAHRTMLFHLAISWPPSRYWPSHRAGASPIATHGLTCQVTAVIGPTRKKGAVSCQGLGSIGLPGCPGKGGSRQHWRQLASGSASLGRL